MVRRTREYSALRRPAQDRRRSGGDLHVSPFDYVRCVVDVHLIALANHVCTSTDLAVPRLALRWRLADEYHRADVEALKVNRKDQAAKYEAQRRYSFCVNPVLARRFGNRNLALENFEDDRRFTLRGPALDRFGSGSRVVGLAAM